MLDRGIQADGQDHHLEFLFLDTFIGRGIADGDIFGLRILFPYGYVASNKSNAGKIRRSLVEPFKILPKGTNIIMEYSTLRLGVMLLGQDHLFLVVRAAHAGAIAVLSLGNTSRANAGNPGDFVGMLQVGRTQDFSLVCSRGGQKPFKIHAGDHIGKLSVVIFLHFPGIKGLQTGSQNDRPHIDVHLLRLLFEIDGVRLADSLTESAFLLLQVETALVNIGNQRKSLREIDVDGFIIGYILIKLIRILYRAVLRADGTTGALVLQNVSGLLSQCYSEISRLSDYTVNVGIRQDLYVWMPADLGQFG